MIKFFRSVRFILRVIVYTKYWENGISVLRHFPFAKRILNGLANVTVNGVNSSGK